MGHGGGCFGWLKWFYGARGGGNVARKSVLTRKTPSKFKT